MLAGCSRRRIRSQTYPRQHCYPNSFRLVLPRSSENCSERRKECILVGRFGLVPLQSCLWIRLCRTLSAASTAIPRAISGYPVLPIVSCKSDCMIDHTAAETRCSLRHRKSAWIRLRRCCLSYRLPRCTRTYLMVARFLHRFQRSYNRKVVVKVNQGAKAHISSKMLGIVHY